MKRIAFFVLFAVSALIGSAFADLNAQTAKITVQGTVVDAANQPVIGAVILEKGSASNASVTDVDGKYSINVPKGATVEVSCVGYITQELTAKSQLNVVLVIDSEFLDEAVVVGYGTQRVATITGSVSQVKSEKLTVAPSSNSTHTIAGQLPGLVAKQTSGLPGQDNASLSIRGFGAPLVIVDGIEGSLETIDASQIESITILKDASGSIYGARAGNGVLLVTTKSGSNAKPTVTFNGSYTLQGNTMTTRPADSAQRARYSNSSFINSGGNPEYAPYTEEEIALFAAGTDPEYLNTDWYGAVVSKFAPMQNYNLSLSGGTDKLKYYAYAGYNSQETQFKFDGGGYERYNFQVNLNADITKNLSLGVNLQYMKDEKNYASGGDLYQDGTNFWEGCIYAADPRYPLYLPDESLLSYANMQNGSPIWAVDIARSGYYRQSRNNMKANGFAEYKIPGVKGLSIKANILYTNNNTHLKWFNKRGKFYTYEAGDDNYNFATSSVKPTELVMSYDTSNHIVQQYSVHFDREFNGHTVSALGMYEVTLDRYAGFNTKRSNFQSTVVEEMVAGDLETIANSSWSSAYGRRSFIGRVDYNYKDKYMVEATLRADASSRFAKGYRWGYFPSVSAGWNIAKEEFMAEAGFVDNLKVRASYGTSGYDGVASFNYLTGYGYDQRYTFGDTQYNGLVSTGLANEHLSWEQMAIGNIGVDFSFFDRKLYGEADVFQRDRKGIPGHRYQSLPSTFGATLPQENLNSICTRGFEFKVGTAGSVSDFQYDVNANISYNRSKWTYYDQAPETDPDRQRLYVNQGQYTDREYGYISEGLFNDQAEIDNWGVSFDELNNDNSNIRPGDVKIKDINDDGVINWRDQKEIGKGKTPHWMAALNVNLAWKGFDLSVLFQGAWGYTTHINYGTQTAIYNELRYDSIYNPDPNAIVPRIAGTLPNYLNSDFNTIDTAYLRLKNASLGYTLPTKLVKKINLSKVRFYVAGMNLFTLSNLKKYGLDPEAEGTVGYSYPQQYTMSVGCNIVF